MSNHEYYPLDFVHSSQSFINEGEPVPHFRLYIQSDEFDSLQTVVFYKFKTQAEYDSFYDSFQKVIINFDESLADFVDTILFQCFASYKQLTDLYFSQDYEANSEYNLGCAKPIADLCLKHLSDEMGIGNLPQLKSHFTFGSFQIDFIEPELNRWLVDLILKAVKDRQYPEKFGFQMEGISVAVANNDVKTLKVIAKQRMITEIFNPREMLKEFCTSVHLKVCEKLEIDHSKVTRPQARLYHKLAVQFDIKDINLYSLSKDKGNKKLENFRMLLQRDLSPTS